MATTNERISVELDADIKGYVANLEQAGKVTSDQAKKMQAAMQAVTASSAKTAGSFKMMKGSATQLGFQLQDVAVQAQMGTSAFTILGQQGSQVASLFGPGGALVGALIAVGAAISGVLVTSLMQGEDTLEEFSKKLEKATEAQLAFIAATDEASRLDAVTVAIRKNESAQDDLIAKIAEYEKRIEQLKQIQEEVPDQFATAEMQISSYQEKIAEAEAKIAKLSQSTEALATESLPEFTDSQSKAQEAASRFVEVLEMQASTMGKSRSEVLAMQASQLQLTDEQKATVDAIIEEMAAREALIEQQKKQREEEKANREAQQFEGRESRLQAIFDKEQEDYELRMEALRQFSLTREEFLVETYQKELEMLNQFQEATGATDEQMYQRRLELAEQFAKDLDRIRGGEVKSSKKNDKDKLKSTQDYTRAASQVAQVAFEDNKAINAGIIVADTAVSVAQSIKNNGGVPLGLPAGAAAAAIGLAQLAANNSASRGGGSVSTPSGSAGTTAQPRQQNFEPETFDLEVSTAGSGTQGVQNVRLDQDSTDDLARALARELRSR